MQGVLGINFILPWIVIIHKQIITMNFIFLWTDYEDFARAIWNYFYYKKENSFLIEYLPNVESFTNEYLNKTSIGPSTSN